VGAAAASAEVRTVLAGALADSGPFEQGADTVQPVRAAGSQGGAGCIVGRTWQPELDDLVGGRAERPAEGMPE
jgi:hypothetical protein